MNNDLVMEFIMVDEFYLENFIHVHGLDHYSVVRKDLEHHHRKNRHEHEMIDQIV
jgi:hypothetical protein